MVIQSLEQFLEDRDCPSSLCFYEDGQCYPWLGATEDGYKIPAWTRAANTSTTLSTEQIDAVTTAAAWSYANPIRQEVVIAGYWTTSGEGDGMRSSKTSHWVKPYYATIDETAFIGTQTLDQWITGRLQAATNSKDFIVSIDNGWVLDPAWIESFNLLTAH